MAKSIKTSSKIRAAKLPVTASPKERTAKKFTELLKTYQSVEEAKVSMAQAMNLWA